MRLALIVAAFLTAAGPAYAYCWNTGGQVICGHNGWLRRALGAYSPQELQGYQQAGEDEYLRRLQILKLERELGIKRKR